MPKPIDLHRLHRQTIADAARKIGVRETARRAGCNPMVVSRFIGGHEGQRCDHFYLIAAAVGYSVQLRAGGPGVNHVLQAIGSDRGGKKR